MLRYGCDAPREGNMKKTVLIVLLLLSVIALASPQPGYSWGPGAAVWAGAALLGAVVGGPGHGYNSGPGYGYPPPASYGYPPPAYGYSAPAYGYAAPAYGYPYYRPRYYPGYGYRGYYGGRGYAYRGYGHRW